MSNIITAKNMCLWYGDHQALKDVNIEIKENNITAFIGFLLFENVYDIK